MTHKILMILGLLLIVGETVAQSNEQPTEKTPAVITNKPSPTPRQISSGVLNGKALSLPKPLYPSEALVSQASGPVTVKVLIDESGNVISAEATTGPLVLRDAAAEAAKLAKFSPTTLEGMPIRVSGVITYNFVLNQSSLKEEEQIAAFIGSFGISFLANTEPQVLEAMGDTNELSDIFAEMLTDIPEEFIDAKPLIEKLSTLKGSERSTAANELLSVMRNKFTGEHEHWYVDSGEDLGKVFAHLIKIKVENNTSAPDTATIKVHLGNLKARSLAAPSDVNKQILSTINAIVELEKKHQIASQEWGEKVIDILDPLFSSFDEDVD